MNSIVNVQLGDLVLSARQPELEKGNLGGYCCLCGVESNELLRPNFRDTFTASEFLHDNALICPTCFYMYNTNEYRYCNFIATGTRFIKLKKGEVLPGILSHDEYPAVMYTTSTYKKQGWMRLVNAVNHSREFLAIGWDMNVFRVSAGRIEGHVKVISYLRGLKFPKKTLVGTPPVNLVRKVPGPLQRSVIRFLERHARDLVWQWVVEFTTKDFAIEAQENEIEALLK